MYLCIISTDEASFLSQSTTCFTFLLSGGHCASAALLLSVLPSAQLNDLSEHWVLLVIPPWAQREATLLQNQTHARLLAMAHTQKRSTLTLAPGLSHSITHCRWSSALKLLKTLSLCVYFSFFFFSPSSLLHNKMPSYPQVILEEQFWIEKRGWQGN